MACQHKFHNDLKLDRLDFEPTTLIVGTFNPEWPATNTTEWFYGRTADSIFWNVLPRLYGEKSLLDATPAEWKQFCHDEKIAFTDLISSIDDADPANREHQKMLGGFSDSALVYNFDDFEFVDVVRLLSNNPSITNVYFTRGITEAFWKHLWGPVMHYCNHNSIHERRLVTPSGDAHDQHEQYNKHNPDAQISLLEDYVLMKWQSEWHAL
jgi:hypothetical protein